MRQRQTDYMTWGVGMMIHFGPYTYLSYVIISSGKDLRLGNARQAGAPTADGYVILEDSTGTQYKIPCEAV